MRLFLFLFVFYSTIFSQAQNYLPNGDFVRINECCEYHVSCAPMGWWTSSGSTFNFEPLRYDKNRQAIPQPALIRMRGLKHANERSYIQAPILCPLKEGAEYTIELHISLRQHRYEHLGILLSDSFIHVPKRTIYNVDTLTGFFQTYLLDSLLRFEPTFVVPLHSRKKQDLQVTFTATGKEKFILIGNFMSDEASSIQHRLFGNPDKGPWFLEVERVSLNGTEHPECECSRQEEIVDLLNRRHSFFGKCEDSIPVDMNHLFQGVPQWDQRYAEEATPAPALPFETGKSYRIDRIYFEFDSSVLLPSSFPTLDSLAILLNAFPAYDVEIHGHTDSLGSAEYNQVLSDRRAAAVRTYLIEQGVDPNRLNSLGYGTSRPLADNSTPEGRQENRRVEFILLEAIPTHTH